MFLVGYLVAGLLVGGLAGFFGIGGGVMLVPLLVFIFGFSQQQAQGTSLAVLIPPIGLFAALEYYRQGFVNVRAAVPLALSFALGAYLVSRLIGTIPEAFLRKCFALFLMFVAGYMLFRGSGPGNSKALWSAGATGSLALGGMAGRVRPDHPEGDRSDNRT